MNCLPELLPPLPHSIRKREIEKIIQLNSKHEIKRFSREIYKKKMWLSFRPLMWGGKSAIFRAQSIAFHLICLKNERNDFSHFVPTVNVVSSCGSSLLLFLLLFIEHEMLHATREPFYLSTYVCIQQEPHILYSLRTRTMSETRNIKIYFMAAINSRFCCVYLTRRFV